MAFGGCHINRIPLAGVGSKTKRFGKRRSGSRITISSPSRLTNSGSVTLRQHGWPRRNDRRFGKRSHFSSAWASSSDSSATRQQCRLGLSNASIAPISSSLSVAESVMNQISRGSTALAKRLSTHFVAYARERGDRIMNNLRVFPLSAVCSLFILSLGHRRSSRQLYRTRPTEQSQR